MSPMATTVPPLTPLPLGRGVRLLGMVLPGMRRVTNQIPPYTAWWDENNRRAAEAEGPLLVSLGDSTAVGVGASEPDRGYVGRFAHYLRTKHDPAWRVVNLALSGARVQDALERQLPIMERLRPDLVMCCVGTNDVVWERGDGQLRRRLQELTDRLPSGTLLSRVPGASRRARMANRTLQQGAERRRMVLLDPWNRPGPPPMGRLAEDRFHPNDVGYQLMAEGFIEAYDDALAGLWG